MPAVSEHLDDEKEIESDLPKLAIVDLRENPLDDAAHELFLPALVKMRGARIQEIPVRHRPRVHGVNKYNIQNRLWRGLADLVGVRWLQSRWIDPRFGEELEGAGAGSIAAGGESDR